MRKGGQQALEEGLAGRTGSPAYADFYTNQWPGVLAVAYSLCGRWDVAEDLAQDALAQAWHKWEEVATMDRPGSWVRTVAANLARSRWRRGVRERVALGRLGGRAAPQEDAARRVDDEDAFWRLVRRLPRRQATAVALYYVGELPVNDVAIAMDCAPGTVRALLHQARGTLAQHLGGTDDSR